MAHTDNVQPEPQVKKQGLGQFKMALRSMLALFIAGAFMFASVDPAFAAKSGGRVGGRAFSSRTTSGPSMSSSRSGVNSSTRTYAAPRTQNRTTTNYYINRGPSVVYGSPFGYGMGYGGYGLGFGGFGFGWNPGLTLGLSITDALIREAERYSYLQRQLEQ